MIKDFSVTPKPKNKKSIFLMCAFFALALVSLIVTFFLDKYKGVVGMVTFLSLITAILIYTKYVAVVFHYDIIGEGVDEPLFVVRQTTGKRNVTLCRIALADITSVKKESAAERRAHKSGVGVSRYVYAPTLAPDESFRIAVFSRHEKAEIVVELTEPFAEMLMTLVAEAKAIRVDSDDE